MERTNKESKRRARRGDGKENRGSAEEWVCE